MRKLAILALVYLFCLELANADSKKDIELEYLKSIAGTSKECFNLNSKTNSAIDNYFEGPIDGQGVSSKSDIDSLTFKLQYKFKGL